ncbi:TIGR00730 family Rossman fold protein [Ammoniphilus resinae]|uniref:Cytokinin riboside 5'-monophosphate phosphoribohydrolase n=1 Tax=Ammoniphilus resinae TaxID=861532 RepID=A0ABS4GU86_9BACL|nr:TIGR00730 family Rossman fold protein [Ammoniphilus resinae]MBP1933843.1 uncharacterized protein (TIGR00730 family) [Ammoniphilus resinae]
MKKICVFAGSNFGANSQFKTNARELGEVLVEKGMELVYGGSNTGLMGEVANRVLELGGKVTGVMPKGLFRGEIVHKGLTQLIEVDDMHQRKATMSELADGYIALPGGFGTLEELFEVICWAQIGIHQKPIGIFNIDQYYTPLLQAMRHMVEAGFVKTSHQKLFLAGSDAAQLVEAMLNYQPPILEKKWDEVK